MIESNLRSAVAQWPACRSYRFTRLQRCNSFGQGDCGQVEQKAIINDVVKFYYTYVLRSQKDRKLYIGWTDNLIKRMEKHNKGQVEATKHRVPFKLVYYEACFSQANAIRREKALKTGFGRKYLKERLKDSKE